MMEVIVIGGSAAGLKAACRISRLQADASVTVIVKDKIFGVSTCGLPYYLSGDIDQASALISTPSGTIKDETYFREVKGVNVLTRHEATLIDRVSRLVHCLDLENDCEIKLPYDRLVIATGTEPLFPGIPGIESEGVMHFQNLNDAKALRNDLERGKIGKVGIIGGGFIGIELCESFLALWGVDVEMIEIQPHVLSEMIDPELARLVESELIEKGVKLHLSCSCTNIKPADDQLVMGKNDGEDMVVDRIIVTAGIRPNVGLAKSAGLELGVTGAIKVNDRMQTSDPDIFAAGDCVELYSALDGKPGIWPFGSLANRMGRTVGDNICNGDSSFGHVVGASILKLFDMTIASVGLTSAQCRENGYDISGCWGSFYDKLFYYPESETQHIKLVYDESNDLVLGVQAAGKGDLLPTVDKASLILQSGWTIDKLMDIEQAYAPPYSQPFDPLHIMAFIAENSHSAGVKLVSPLDFEDLPSDTVILDVRSQDEIEAQPLETGDKRRFEIPVEELRSRIREIPRNVSIVTVCQMGTRGWDSALILRRAGWSNVGNLGGGATFLPLKKV